MCGWDLGRVPSGAEMKKQFKNAAKEAGLNLKGAVYLGKGPDVFSVIIASERNIERKLLIPGPNFRQGHIFCF